jgi:triosephosphate isomerase
MVLQVKKGSTLKVHSHTLLEARIADLEEAKQAVSERRNRKKKRIQKGGSLSQVEAEDIVAQRDVKV